MLFIETARLNLLPTAARQFVREVQERYQDAHDLEQSATKRLNEIGERLFVLDKAFMSGGRITEAQAAERKILQDDHDAASRRLAQQRERNRANVDLLAHVDRWLSTSDRTISHVHSPAVEFVDVPLPTAKGDLAQVRADIADLANRRRRVERAPLCRAELEARIVESVKSLSRAGKPRFRGLDGREAFFVGFPTVEQEPKPFTLLAWFDPEALIQRLIAELPPAVEDAMSASAKHKTLADIDARKLTLERLEEALVRSIGAERRPDADVRAVLSIAERPRAAAAA